MRLLTNRVRDRRQDRRDQRIVGNWPAVSVACPALTSGAVPRSIPPTCEKMPTAATTVAQASPITTIFKCVPRSALYMEWLLIMPSRSFNRLVAGFTQKVHSNSQNVGTRFLPQHGPSPSGDGA